MPDSNTKRYNYNHRYNINNYNIVILLPNINGLTVTLLGYYHHKYYTLSYVVILIILNSYFITIL